MRASLLGMLLLLGLGLGPCAWSGKAPPAEHPRAGQEFRIASYQPRPGWRRATYGKAGQPVYIGPDVIVASRDIQSIRYRGCNPAVIDHCGLEIVLTPAGGKRMLEATQTHIGKPMTWLLHGKVLSLATIWSVFGKRFEVSVGDERETRAVLKRVVR